MNTDYIITNDYMKINYGLNLNDYALNGDMVVPIIRMALDLVVTRILEMNDDFSYESDIESAIDDDEDLLTPFLKLQYRVIYNLIFLGDNDPLDKTVDSIICFDLKWGKINGFQKKVFGARG